MTALPESYRARLRDLTILVVRRGSHATWAWQIRRGGEKIQDHDPVWPFNENERSAKLEAVTAATEMLRMPEGPEETLAMLEWETFPAENPATQK